jgi:hypothetical protein
VTAVPPAVTVAVSVTAVPELTELTVVPFDETARVVVVVALAKSCELPQRSIQDAAIVEIDVLRRVR